MERLTEKDDYDGYKIEAKNLTDHCVSKDKRGYITYRGQHIEKLAEYEDLEEQGLLLRLPCKAGSTVYKIITQRDNFDDRAYKIVSAIEFRISMIDEIGKTVFLTKEEAEQKLKEMEDK